MLFTKQYACFFIFIFFISFIVSCGEDERLNTGNPSPEIIAISPDSGFAGDHITIKATGLVPEIEENRVLFDGTPATVLSLSQGSLVAQVPKKATSGAISLEVKGHTVTGPYFKVLTHGPVIHAVAPKKGGPGTRITITGNNFLPPLAVSKNNDENNRRLSLQGKTDSSFAQAIRPIIPSGSDQKNMAVRGISISITVGGVLAPILTLSNSELITEVPEGTAGSTIEITVGDKSATSTAFTVILPPEITSFTPAKGAPGTQVTISGAHFSPTADSNAVYFNGTPSAITEASSAELTVTVPQGATSGPIKIVVDGQTDNTIQNFTVTEAPTPPVPQVTISDITPKQGPVGTQVTITGENFSTTKTDNTITFNGTKATVNSASATKLVVTVPNDATSGPVKVKVGNQTDTGPNFNVTVNQPPTITNGSSFAVDENTTGVGNIIATDPDGDALTFSISDGADQSVFSINSTSGALAFKNAPDFENPADADINNAYEVTIEVSDGKQTNSQPLTITVTDVNEAPRITSNAGSSVDENASLTIPVTATDPEGNTLTYHLNGGSDQGHFSIADPLIGEVFFTAPSFEVPEDANADNIYEVQIEVSDGSLTAAQTLQITVTDVDDAPKINNPDSSPPGLDPSNGITGTLVEINGANFSPAPDENIVTFNGITAPVINASENTLLVKVPTGATSGQVQVTVDSQTTSIPIFFNVFTPVTVAMGAGVTVSSGPGSCSGCNVTNSANLIDTDSENFVSITLVTPAPAAETTFLSLNAGEPFQNIDPTIPPNDLFVGFLIGKAGGGPIQADEIIIETYLDDAFQESFTGNELETVNLFRNGMVNTPTFFGIFPQNNVDEILIRFNISAGITFEVYYGAFAEILIH